MVKPYPCCNVSIEGPHYETKFSMSQAKAICNEFVDDICANQRTRCYWNGINITNLPSPTLFNVNV